MKAPETAVKLPPTIDSVVVCQRYRGHDHERRYSLRWMLSNSIRKRNENIPDLQIGECRLMKFSKTDNMHVCINDCVVQENGGERLNIGGKHVTFIGRPKHKETVLVVWRNGSVHPLDEPTKIKIRRMMQGFNLSFNAFHC